MPPTPIPPFFGRQFNGVHVIRFGPGSQPWHGLIGLVLVAVVVCVAAIVVAALLERRPRETRASGDGGPATPNVSTSALQILDERFARGEIDADDYTSRRQLISSLR